MENLFNKIRKRPMIDIEELPSIPEGCSILEHHTWDYQTKIPLSSLKILLLNHQMGSIEADRLFIDIKYSDKKPANATVLDWLLKNQKIIPHKCKQMKVCFWGTVFMGEDDTFIKQLLWMPDEKKYTYRRISLQKQYVNSDAPALIISIP